MFQKTVAINDFYFAGPGIPYPLGHIQSQGRTHGIMAKAVGDSVVPRIPLWAYDAWVARGVDWLAMSEDLPDPDNRVTVDADGRSVLRYRPNNVARASAARRGDHADAETARLLGGDDALAQDHRTPRISAARSCFGTDPATSVLDPFCRAHDVENLFVVDASFFPSSAAVNPGLTIIAQALRVADHLRETLVGHAAG